MITAKKRCLRTRRASDSSDSEGANAEDHMEVSSVRNSVVVVEAIRELQKVRKRPAGISLSALSTGKVAPEELAIVSDPFKLKTGGLVVMRHVVDPKSNEDEDDVEARLAKTFATETNKRDEDAEMIKYIEEEVARRKGLRKSPSPEPRNTSLNYPIIRLQYNHSNVAHPSDADYKRDLSSISVKKEPPKPEPCNSEQVHLEKERERLRAERATDSIALQRFRSYMRDRRRR
ncbi:hypothetical protein EG68_05456 [Paragonimus skrjabini miyazakii]|uniref:Uncharacterized protein n=1 Tax=Paragonimus skrjabini miyazakii TaxID=59628 RepID=A0A8S9YZI5_9TREM|nr:hypothetical protein EG68_05456 [Paragonimus skrjabini miyazakii]